VKWMCSNGYGMEGEDLIMYYYKKT